MKTSTLDRNREISGIEEEVITVAEIVEMMNVSDMTIRRDLAVLEEQGLITRIHGGARSIQQLKYREVPS